MTAGNQPGPAPRGRLVTCMIWALVLLALWLWGRSATDGVLGASGVGGVPAAGQQLGAEVPLPPAQDPLADTGRPAHLDIGSLDVHAKVTGTGLDDGGGVAAPPYKRADQVGWYRDGPRPGEEGTAVLVGHVDTDSERAVFYPLSTVERGARVEVTGADGRVMEFTVESTDVVQSAGFDARKAYGPREEGRAELRLITCGGTYDRAEKTYTANVVVSAYLTGSRAA